MKKQNRDLSFKIKRYFNAAEVEVDITSNIKNVELLMKELSNEEIVQLYNSPEFESFDPVFQELVMDALNIIFKKESDGMF